MSPCPYDLWGCGSGTEGKGHGGEAEARGLRRVAGSAVLAQTVLVSGTVLRTLPETWGN